MTANEPTQTVSIDGVEYNPAELSAQQAYLLKQIDDLHKKAMSLHFQLDQVEVAKRAFVGAFKEATVPEETSDG